MLDKLERKFGKFAISNLMLYIIIGNVAVYLYTIMSGSTILIEQLALIPQKVFQGEVWRIIGFIFIPETTGIFTLLLLLAYYSFAQSLERYWGSFKFNVYYFLGIICHIAVAFIFDINMYAPTYLNLSLILAIAKIVPDITILLYFIIPVPLKYLAWIYWIFIGISFVSTPFPQNIAVIVPLINYFIFFGKDMLRHNKKANNIKYVKFDAKKSKSIHKCTICGITEQQDKTMEFRYCSKCDGFHEYCMNHLHDHKHIVESDKN